MSGEARDHRVLAAIILQSSVKVVGFSFITRAMVWPPGSRHAQRVKVKRRAHAVVVRQDEAIKSDVEREMQPRIIHGRKIVGRR